MMGFNHVSCGLAAGLATLPLAPLHTWPAQTAWVLACGGTALLPDLDSRQSTAARMWGPLTESLAGGIAVLARGHRWGTHDLVLAPLAGAGLTLLAATNPWTLGLLLALTTGLALRGLALAGAGRIGGTVNLIISAAVAWWLATSGAGRTQLLPVVVALGIAVHILGDLLTEEGIPLPVLWLFGHRRRVAVQAFHTNSVLERALVAPALSLLGVWLFCQRAGIHDVPSLVLWSGDLVHALTRS
jgi:membrane-bound metal-dependent hydrolase YbcI (DUF457 family)